VKLQLSLGITSNPRTWPIIDGRVVPDAIDPAINVCDPSELFWRQLRFAEFDVSEMSMSSLMMIRAQGDERFVGLPVFTTRRFFHTNILVRRDARINVPADLKGKRVGVPEYQQTAALWIRGVIQSEFGVTPRDMEFWMERVPARSHAGAVGFKPVQTQFNVVQIVTLAALYSVGAAHKGVGAVGEDHGRGHAHRLPMSGR